MLFATYGQFEIFLWMVGAGATSGALYGVATFLRHLLSAKRWLGMTIDALWGAASAGVLLAAQIYADYGRFRFYSFLGALLGMGLFCHGPLPLLRALFRRVRDIIEKIWTRVAANRLIKALFR